MKRIGLIGVNTSHADAFSRLINGAAVANPEVPGIRVTGIWGDDVRRVAELVTRHDIDTIVGKPTDLIGQVDGVLIVDDADGGARHAELARPFLEAGIPTFIDKPMTTDLAEAEALFELAEANGAPLMSCSALRFARELEEVRPALEDLGTLSSVVSVGPGDWFYYGIHTVELLSALIGTPAQSVHRHAFDQRDVVVIDYGPGKPTAVVETLRDAGYDFEFTVYGELGRHRFTVEDFNGFYGNTMRAFATMVETGTPPITAEQTLEVLRVLHAGNASAESGETVSLAAAEEVVPAEKEEALSKETVPA